MTGRCRKVYQAQYCKVLVKAANVSWCCRCAGNCLGGAGFGRGLVSRGCRVSLLIRFLRLGGELLVGYVPGICLRVLLFSDSLSDICAFLTLAIRELLKFSSEDTGVSPLSRLSKSTSDSAKRSVAFP